MDLPHGVDDLIEAVLAAEPNAIIVTQSGTPFTMPWISRAKTVLHTWYGGNEIGNGIADVIYGKISPSGKLPLSWPKRIEDNPSFLCFGSDNERVWYGEDVYVGYRYYNTKKVDVLFPFG